MSLPFKPVAFAAILALSAPALAQDDAMTDAANLTYPDTRTVDVSEVQFGIDVADPYRWLEDDVRVNTEVAEWVAAQNAVTDTYLDTLPGRDALAATMTGLFDYDKLETPVEAGGTYFYERRSGDQKQAVLYARDGVDGEERVLIDPNGWSDDGADALSGWTPSQDGSKLAYMIQKGGSDWRTIKVVDVASGTVLDDTVEWAKFSGLSWMPQNAGFLYSRFPEPEDGAEFQSLNENHTVYLHPLGATQDKDVIIYRTRNQPELNHVAELTSDKEWIVLTASSGTDERYEISLVKVDSPRFQVRKLIEGFTHDWRLIDGIGDELYFITNQDAPRLRIVKVDVSGEEPTFTEIVGEDEAVIDEAAIVGDTLVVNYMVDANSRLSIFSLDGQSAYGTLALPGIGQVSGLDGSHKAGEGFFAFESFNRPPTIYRYDGKSPPSVLAKPELPFDPDTIQVEQRFYKSKDGTDIPMFLVHRDDVSLDEATPTLLYGYGGFNISVLPEYREHWAAWVQSGGVFAVANIRGGGEYGKAWHDGGRLANKQNVFDDFIAAGEYLKAEGIAPENGLAIEGRSNGGLLVGAVVNQRPDLFDAGHAAVGVMDMLRFDRFTAGRYWVDDYGYPDKEPDFKTLLAYSPYHNIADGADYPALIVSTADTDDRVVPGHSFKYISALQAADAGDAPHVIRIETRAGHGSGKPTDKLIEEYSDLYAFLAAHTGLVPDDPAGE